MAQSDYVDTALPGKQGYLIFEINHLTKELAKYRKALEDDDFDGLRDLLDEGRQIKEEVDGI